MAQATNSLTESNSSARNLKERVESLRLSPSITGAQRTRPIVPWILCVLSCAATVYLAVYRNAPATTSAAKQTAVAASTTATAGGIGDGASPSVGDGSGIVLEAKGYIVPKQQILVSPEVGGRIVELNFQEGMKVEAGYVLARLDRTEIQAEYDRSMATVELAQSKLLEVQEGNRPDEIRQTKAELAESEENLKQAENTFERKRDLRNAKVITQQDFEESESSYLALKKRVERLQAGVRLAEEGPRTERKRQAAAELRQAEADLARTRRRLDNCIIPAPVTGTILKKNAELGNFINPGAFNGSFSLCEMADLGRMEVTLDINETDISKVAVGQPCTIRTEAFPKRAYEGHVSRLMPIADRAKAAIPVRVDIVIPADEEGVYLKPEMGAVVTFYSADSKLAKEGTKASESEPEPTTP